MAFHGTGDAAIKANPTIPIVILAGRGNIPKNIKKAPIRAKETPNTNLRRNPCFRFTIVDPPIILRVIN